MFKEHVSKLKDNQLKTRNKFCLGIAIGYLIGMIALIVLSLFQISNQNDGATFTALTPVIAMPLIFLPLTYSSALSAEIKRRKVNSGKESA